MFGKPASQWFQLPFVRTPGPDAPPVQGSTDLCTAGCRNRRGIARQILFPTRVVQAAEAHRRGQRLLRPVDEVFVPHGPEMRRTGTFPVLGEAPEIGVMVREFRQVVAVGIGAVREQFLEVGIARIHRITHQAQDACLRQGARDETGVVDVHRILVDQAGMALPVTVRGGGIARGHHPVIHPFGRFDHGAPRRRFVERVHGPGHAAREGVEFSGGMNVTVVAQHAIQHRGPRTGHADHEDMGGRPGEGHARAVIADRSCHQRSDTVIIARLIVALAVTA